MPNLEFKCPDCGNAGLEEVRADIICAVVVTQVREHQDVTTQYLQVQISYGAQTHTSGHIDHYQCSACGYLIVDGESPHAAAGLNEYALAKALKALGAGGQWTEHPTCPVSDWQYEVANDDTRLGYLDWIKHQEQE